MGLDFLYSGGIYYRLNAVGCFALCVGGSAEVSIERPGGETGGFRPTGKASRDDGFHGMNSTAFARSATMEKYVCQICGYVYDPANGDPDGGIAPGTSFRDLPEDWVCPVCGAAKSDFEKE